MIEEPIADDSATILGGEVVPLDKTVFQAKVAESTMEIEQRFYESKASCHQATREFMDERERIVFDKAEQSQTHFSSSSVLPSKTSSEATEITKENIFDEAEEPPIVQPAMVSTSPQPTAAKKQTFITRAAAPAAQSTWVQLIEEVGNTFDDDDDLLTQPKGEHETAPTQRAPTQRDVKKSVPREQSFWSQMMGLATEIGNTFDDEDEE